MDDDGFLIIFFTMIFAVFIILMVGLAVHSNDGKDEKREDKRYEMCIDKGMQWVDGNCIGSTK